MKERVSDEEIRKDLKFWGFDRGLEPTSYQSRLACDLRDARARIAELEAAHDKGLAEAKKAGLRRAVEVVRAMPETIRKTKTIAEHEDITSMGMPFVVPARQVKIDCVTTFDDVLDALRAEEARQ